MCPEIRGKIIFLPTFTWLFVNLKRTMSVFSGYGWECGRKETQDQEKGRMILFDVLILYTLSEDIWKCALYDKIFL